MISPARSFYGWSNVGLLFVIYLSAMGMVFYGFSVIFPSMVQEMGWGRGEAAFAHTLRGLLLGFTAPLVALALQKFGGRNTIAVGLSLLCLGSVLLGVATRELWHWTLIWGFVMPWGFALGGLMPIQSTVAQWFDVYRATAMGAVMTAAGVGGFLAQPLYTKVIELSGWQVAWLTAAGFALLGLVAALFLKSTPQEFGQNPDGIDPSAPSSRREAGERVSRTYKTTVTFSVRQAIRTRTLWLVILLFMALAMPLYLITAHGVLHLTDGGFSAMQAASVLSFIVGGSAFARFPAGWIGDRIEPRWVLAVSQTVMLLGFLVLWRTSSLSALLICGPIFGLAFGSAVVMVPTLIANYFGAQSFASINGFIMPVTIGFSAMVPVGAGYLADTYGTYDLAFAVLSILLAASVAGALLAAPPAVPDTGPSRLGSD